MTHRTIAIGDIHGCSTALAALIKAINPQPNDTLVTLGDYVDRGPDSKGVLDLLINLANQCRLVSILGNHDDLMLHARESDAKFQVWTKCGGTGALDSYQGPTRIDAIPESHFEFLAQCVPFFETGTHFFVHANYEPDLPLDRMDIHVIRWLSLRDYVPSPHFSGKVAVVGHTPQDEILDLGHLICLDTGCCNGGWLTALEVNSRQCWQVDEWGATR